MGKLFLLGILGLVCSQVRGHENAEWTPRIRPLTEADLERVKVLKLDQLESPRYRLREDMQKKLAALLKAGVPTPEFPSIPEVVTLLDKLSMKPDPDLQNRVKALFDKNEGSWETVDWKALGCRINATIAKRPRVQEMKSLMDRIIPSVVPFTPDSPSSDITAAMMDRLKGLNAKTESDRVHVERKDKRDFFEAKLDFNEKKEKYVVLETPTVMAIDLLKELPPLMQARYQRQMPTKFVELYNMIGKLYPASGGGFTPHFSLRTEVWRVLKSFLLDDLRLGKAGLARYFESIGDGVCPNDPSLEPASKNVANNLMGHAITYDANQGHF